MSHHHKTLPHHLNLLYNDRLGVWEEVHRGMGLCLVWLRIHAMDVLIFAG